MGRLGGVWITGVELSHGEGRVSLPLIEDCIDMLAGQKWFSKLDANSAYWKIKIKESDRKKTAFTTLFK
ncbi:hypothetical protein DPMN_164462 [Dreissena polymorpha]|uniref:Reverse transcriptase n=1 Tax=Dreissena polymorpha TaxID=45954 RepID=A0A9D4ETR1_DREPO|nr:hypothetical protein DPMN_164462 [Dreissena polymorpha]